MAGERAYPGPVLEPKTRVGRWLWDIRGVLTGPAGQRAYDKKRITILLVLLLTVQAGVQLATHVITLQFSAHDKLISALLAYQSTQHSETVARTDANTRALERLACELRASNDTTRAAIWRERPREREECK